MNKITSHFSITISSVFIISAVRAELQVLFSIWYLVTKSNTHMFVQKAGWGTNYDLASMSI